MDIWVVTNFFGRYEFIHIQDFVDMFAFLLGK